MAPQAKILRVFAAGKENFAGFCGREGTFCGFHGLHYLLRMQLPTPGFGVPARVRLYRPPKTAGRAKSRHAVDRPASSLSQGCARLLDSHNTPARPSMVVNVRAAREHGMHSRPRGPAPPDFPNWNAEEGI